MGVSDGWTALVSRGSLLLLHRAAGRALWAPASGSSPPCCGLAEQEAVCPELGRRVCRAGGVSGVWCQTRLSEGGLEEEEVGGLVELGATVMACPYDGTGPEVRKVQKR